MKSIKKFEDFTNEEVNIKKSLTGAILGAGIALSNPSFSQTKSDSTLTHRIEKKVEFKKSFIHSSRVKGYVYKGDSIEGNWEKLRYSGYYTEEKYGVKEGSKFTCMVSENLEDYGKIILRFGDSTNYTPTSHPSFSLTSVFLFDKKNIDTLRNLDFDKTYKFNLYLVLYDRKILNDYNKHISKVDYNEDRIIKDVLLSQPNSILYVKIGYLDGKKIVRFQVYPHKYKEEKLDYGFDYCYYELDWEEFINFFNF